MKTVATFCVLATVCFFGTGNADSTDEAVDVMRQLKATVQLKISQVQSYGSTLVSDLDTKLEDKKNAALTNLNSITKPTVNSVRADVDAAKASGKNAEHCYEATEYALAQASHILLDQCKKRALGIVNVVKSNVDATVSVGNQLTKRLDNINFRCLLLPYVSYSRCINSEISTISPAIKKFDATVDQVKSTGDSLSSSAVTSASSCNEDSAKEVREFAENKVLVSARNCIAKA